jgi:hypothetical protein
MDFIENGLTPDTPEELAEIAAGAATYSSVFGDGEWAHGVYPQGKYDIPPEITWDSFVPELKKRKAHYNSLRNNGWCLFWWEIARALGLPMDKVLSANQLSFSSCAGWSAAMTYSRKVIYQMLSAPIKWEKINPLPTWAITKGYSTRGGASMLQVKLGTSKYGNYAVTDTGIGEYPGTVSKATYETAAPLAQKRQLCSAVMPATVANLQLCLDACEVVAIGNRTACKTSRIDNGIKIGVLGGTWSHATVYDSIRYVKGKPLFHWSNSWGAYYKGSKENCPDIGCWLTEEQAAQMLDGASCWTTVYAEAFPAFKQGETPLLPTFIPVSDYVIR